MNMVPKYTTHSFAEKRFDTALIIPVINEGGKIISQLKRLATIDCQVDIIIADGDSDDGSLSDYIFLDELNVNTILVKKDAGKLSAQLRMAFDFGIKRGYRYFITMDGNDKDGSEGIGRIINKLEQGYDFVQGSRFIPGGIAENTPKIRFLAIKCFHAPLTSIAARNKFTDTTNGFRGFSRKLIESKDVALFREVFDTYELLFYIPIRASRLKFRVAEVPVSRRYPKAGLVPTKIQGVRAYFSLIRILTFAAIGMYNPK